MDALTPLTEKYECFKEVRGKGMMIALEFTEPKSPMLKLSWKMLESANKGTVLTVDNRPVIQAAPGSVSGSRPRHEYRQIHSTTHPDRIRCSMDRYCGQ